jgi:hypothetical protein
LKETLAMKKHSVKTFVPLSAVAAVFGLAASSGSAQTSPIFEANFPASWNGTGTTVLDQSGAGNTGFKSGTASYTTAAVPSWATPGTGSIALGGVGGVKVTPTGLLNNTAIATAGGFTYSVDFLWDGTDSSASFGGAEKLIDYAGTESLQLLVPSGAGSASLQMNFADDLGVESTAVSTTIAPNTWYNVVLTFGNTTMVGSDVTGTANLYLNGSLVSSASATKGDYGDGLNRPIGIGEWGYGHTTSLIGLHGDIYDASIQFGVAPVPEPSTVALGALGGLGMMFLRRKKS